MARVQAGRLCGVLPQGSPPPVPPMVGNVAAPSNGAGIRHLIHRSGGCGAPSFACGGCWRLCWLCVGASSRRPLAGGHVCQGDGRHQRPGQRVRHPACRRRTCNEASRGWCRQQVLRFRHLQVFLRVVSNLARASWVRHRSREAQYWEVHDGDHLEQTRRGHLLRRGQVCCRAAAWRRDQTEAGPTWCLNLQVHRRSYEH